jgi:2-dehydro-3-deoxyphosphooctonate aldolase (KDO 8-P synthase)
MNVEPAPNPVVAVGAARFGNALPLALIAGPCALESRDHAFEMAAALKDIAGKIGIGFVYKTSFDKANRTSAKSNRGIGLDGALPIFAEIRRKFGVPVLTDVHEAEQCTRVAEVVDVLQIPAFLCRQTDLLVAAAATGRVVNVKKGQFLAPWDMANVVGKVTDAGNSHVLVTERGASFGYKTLVSDRRSLPIWRARPVRRHLRCHPFGAATRREGYFVGGEREFVPCSARGGRGRRRRGLHRDPPGPRPGALRWPNMIPLKQLEPLLRRLIEFDKLAKSN